MKMLYEKYHQLNLFIIDCTAVSCKKKAGLDANEVLTLCGTKDPLKNIGWLKTEYAKIATSPTVNGIILYRYNNNEVIEIQNAQFSSTNQHQYSCDGVKLNLDDPSEFNKYRQERKLIGVLFGTNIWN